MSQAWARKLLPSLPESIATIEDAWNAISLGSNKTLILIQDAHTNPSAQKNITKTLDLLLKKEKITTVFVEAGFNDVSLLPLKKAPLEKRKIVGMSYLQKGELSGAEYLNLTRDQDFILWGVEDESLYWKSLETYREITKQRKKFEEYLTKIEITIQTLKPKLFNPTLLFFDQKHEDFLNEKISLTDYFTILARQSRQSNINLDYYPHIQKLQNLKDKEQTINWKLANEEEQKSIELLTQEELEGLKLASLSKLTGQDHKNQDAFLALLEEKLKDKDEYPELKKYLSYLKESKKFDTRKILEEQKLLEQQIYESLAQTQDEQRLHKASKNLRSLKALLNLTLTPDEFHAYEENPKDFDLVQMTGFLNKKIMDLQSYYDRAIFLQKAYEDVLKKAEEFYRLTRQRDEVFISKTIQKMNEQNLNKAILVTGGYHSPNVKALLKDKNISYVCLTPQILHETNLKRYESLLLGQTSSIIARSSKGDEAISTDKIALVEVANRPEGSRLATMGTLASGLGIGKENAVSIEVPSKDGARMASQSSRVDTQSHHKKASGTRLTDDEYFEGLEKQFGRWTESKVHKLHLGFRNRIKDILQIRRKRSPNAFAMETMRNLMLPVEGGAFLELLRRAKERDTDLLERLEALQQQMAVWFRDPDFIRFDAGSNVWYRLCGFLKVRPDSIEKSIRTQKPDFQRLSPSELLAMAFSSEWIYGGGVDLESNSHRQIFLDFMGSLKDSKKAGEYYENFSRLRDEVARATHWDLWHRVGDGHRYNVRAFHSLESDSRFKEITLAVDYFPVTGELYAALRPEHVHAEQHASGPSIAYELEVPIRSISVSYLMFDYPNPKTEVSDEEGNQSEVFIDSSEVPSKKLHIVHKYYTDELGDQPIDGSPTWGMALRAGPKLKLPFFTSKGPDAIGARLAAWFKTSWEFLKSAWGYLRMFIKEVAELWQRYPLRTTLGIIVIVAAVYWLGLQIAAVVYLLGPWLSLLLLIVPIVVGITNHLLKTLERVLRARRDAKERKSKAVQIIDELGLNPAKEARLFLKFIKWLKLAESGRDAGFSFLEMSVLQSGASELRQRTDNKALLFTVFDFVLDTLIFLAESGGQGEEFGIELMSFMDEIVEMVGNQREPEKVLSYMKNLMQAFKVKGIIPGGKADESWKLLGAIAELANTAVSSEQFNQCLDMGLRLLEKGIDPSYDFIYAVPAFMQVTRNPHRQETFPWFVETLLTRFEAEEISPYSAIGRSEIGFLLYLSQHFPELFDAESNWLPILKKLSTQLQEDANRYPEAQRARFLEETYHRIDQYIDRYRVNKGDSTDRLSEYSEILSFLQIVHINLPLVLGAIENIGKHAVEFRELRKALPFNNPLTRIIRMLGEGGDLIGGYQDIVFEMIENNQFDAFYKILVDVARRRGEEAPQEVSGMLQILESSPGMSRWTDRDWFVFRNRIARYYENNFGVIAHNLFQYFVSHENDPVAISSMKKDIAKELETREIALGKFNGFSELFKIKYGLTTEDELALISRVMPVTNLTIKDYAPKAEEVKAALSQRGAEWAAEVDLDLRSPFSLQGSQSIVVYNPDEGAGVNRDALHRRLIGYIKGGPVAPGARLALLKAIENFVLKPDDATNKESLKRALVDFAIQNRQLNKDHYSKVPQGDEDIQAWLERWYVLLQDYLKHDAVDKIREMVREVVSKMDWRQYARLLSEKKVAEFISVKNKKDLFREDPAIIAALGDSQLSPEEKQEMLADMFYRKWFALLKADEIREEAVINDWIHRGKIGDRAIDKFARRLHAKVSKDNPDLELNEEGMATIVVKALLDARKQKEEEIKATTDSDRQRIMVADTITRNLLSLFAQDLSDIERELKGFSSLEAGTSEVFRTGFFDDFFHLMGFMMTGVCTWADRDKQILNKRYHFGKLSLQSSSGQVLGLSQVQLIRSSIRGMPAKVSPKGWQVMALPGIHLATGNIGMDKERAFLALLETAQRLAERLGMQGAVIPIDENIHSNNPYERQMIQQLAAMGFLKKVSLSEAVELTTGYPYQKVYLVALPRDNFFLHEGILSEGTAPAEQETGGIENAVVLSFGKEMGDFVYDNEIPVSVVTPLKAAIETTLSNMPSNVLDNIRFNAWVQNTAVRIRVEPWLEESRIEKSESKVELWIGKDVLYAEGKVETVTLSEMLSELLAAFILDDYKELKDKSRVNENAYFKLELVKSFLNYKSYLFRYHKTLNKHNWNESNYLVEKNAEERKRVLEEHKASLDKYTEDWDDILQWRLFLSVMDDTDPDFIVTNYLHLLMMRGLLDDNTAAEFIVRTTKLEVLNKPSLVALRNIVKDFALPSPPGGRRVFNYFDQTTTMTKWWDELLGTSQESEFYETLRAVLGTFLNLPDDDINKEMSGLLDRQIFNSRDRERAIHDAIEEVLTRRIGKNAFTSVRQHLTGERGFEAIPYIELNTLDLPEGTDADEYSGFRRYLTQDGIDHELVFQGAEEPKDTSDWVRELFPIQGARMASTDFSNNPWLKLSKAFANNPTSLESFEQWVARLDVQLFGPADQSRLSPEKIDRLNFDKEVRGGPDSPFVLELIDYIYRSFQKIRSLAEVGSKEQETISEAEAATRVRTALVRLNRILAEADLSNRLKRYLRVIIQNPEASDPSFMYRETALAISLLPGFRSESIQELSRKFEDAYSQDPEVVEGFLAKLAEQLIGEPFAEGADLFYFLAQTEADNLPEAESEDDVYQRASELESMGELIRQETSEQLLKLLNQIQISADLKEKLEERDEIKRFRDFMAGGARLASINQEPTAFELLTQSLKSQDRFRGYTHLDILKKTAVSEPNQEAANVAIQESEVITFIAHVVCEQNREGDLALGDTLLHVLRDSKGDYWLEGLGNPIPIDRKNIVLKDRDRAKVTVSMSDYKMILEEADRSVNRFFENIPEPVSRVKVIEAFDLNILPKDSFGPSLSYHLKRYILEHKSDPNFVVLFQGASWQIDQAMAEANVLLGSEQKFFFETFEKLADALPDYRKDAKLVSIDAFDGNKVITPKLLNTGEIKPRHFVMRILKKGELMHPAAHRVARLEARLPELAMNSLFERYLNAYQTLLGHPIQDTGEFIQVSQGQALPNLSFYALPPLLHVEEILQVLRMAEKMAGQSA